MERFIRLNGKPLQPVLGVARTATLANSASAREDALYAEKQNAQLKGSMPLKGIQSMRVHLLASDGLSESF